MSREILTVVDNVSNEKCVAPEIIFEALEAALVSATRKRQPEDADIRVSIDRLTGEYETFRRWEVVDDSRVVLEESELPEMDVEDEADNPDAPILFAPERQVLLSEARKSDPDVLAGTFLEESIESVSFGRISAQAAKQVIVQKVREAERSQIVEAYEDKVGELLSGVVKRMERGNVIVDLGGNAEAVILRDELIPREITKPGDRIRGYLRAVRPEPRGPQLFISRTAPELMMELFKLEVPEIGEGLIQIVNCARDPGSRAKIGVRSQVARIDPVGACVGMRGSRVQAVSNELAGERVDIIPWSEDIAQYVINAMSPAEVLSIVVDEDARSMDVAVAEEQLSQAIGRGGQNVRLASQLTGWELNVMTEAQSAEKNEQEAAELVKMFSELLDVDEELAQILVQEGFRSIADVADVAESELLEISDFDEEIVRELQSRAGDVLLAQTLAQNEGLTDQEPEEDLLALKGMDEDLARALARHGVVNLDDLAELSIDEVCDMVDVDRTLAGELIMASRASWFEDSESAESQ